VVDTFSVKVNSIPGQLPENALEILMGEFGEVESCWMPPMMPNRKNLKFAVVRFSEEYEAATALKVGELWFSGF